MNKLELLALAKDYSVKEIKSGYRVDCMNADLSADISNNGKITYYITGCYNSGFDYVEIDIEELKKLKQFCELMVN